MLEHLEQRQMLTLPISGGIIQITGAPYVTAGPDFLEVIVSGSTLQLRNGLGTVVDSRSLSGVIGININGGGGIDVIRIGTASGGSMPNLPVTIHGGAGNDSITGGNRDDQLFGDGDNDRLDGRAGRDLLDGGSGFDTADYSYRTVPVRVSLNNVANDGSNSGNNSSPAQYNDQGGDNARELEGVIGGTGNDSLVGNSAANWLDGGGGNDSLFGGNGIDTIVGSVAADLAYGEGGDDFLFFQDSTGDRFDGGAGSTIAQFDKSLDTRAPVLSVTPSAIAPAAEEDDQVTVTQELNAKEVQDFQFNFLDENFLPQILPDYLVLRVKALKPDGTFEIFGTPFADVIKVTEKDGIITANINGFLWQQTASDVTSLLIHLGDGNDELVIDKSVHVGSTIEGGAGNDTIIGGNKADSIKAEDGDDLVLGRGGADGIAGGAGRDILIGGAGADSLRGGDGEDVLFGGSTILDRECTYILKILPKLITDRVRPIQSITLGECLLRTAIRFNLISDDKTTDFLAGEVDADWIIAKNGSNADVVAEQESRDRVTRF